MQCKKCGAAMKQTGKDTFSGREIREYECGDCGHSDWEDSGPALWQLLADARAEDEAGQWAANRTDAEAKQAAAGSRWSRLATSFAGLLGRKR